VSEIEVNALGPGEFGVQVREGDTTTSHRVTVPDDMADDLHLGAVDPSQLVEVSFAFLLEREPGTAILRQFSLRDISRYFPEYAEELQRRLRPLS
jgi:hypothetical protein